MTLRGTKVHCGVCAACLLRRQSLLQAALHDGEQYQWPNLRAASLAEAAAEGGDRQTRTISGMPRVAHFA